MLVLLVLLACLVSILVITLFKVENMNHQVITFEVVVILFILFKIIFDLVVKKNMKNPVSESVMNNVVSSISNEKPSNFNVALNSPTPDEVVLNNILKTQNVSNGNNNNNLNLADNNHLVDDKHINGNNTLNGNNNLNGSNSNNAINAVEANNLVNNLENVGSDLQNETNSNNSNNTNNGCLLNECACKNVDQNLSCGAVNNNSGNSCPSCPFVNAHNGANVPENCIRNDTVNYGDLLNTDLYKNVANKRDCASDNSCVINSDKTNLHMDSELSSPNKKQVPHPNKSLDSMTVLPKPENVSGAIPSHEGPHPGDPEFSNMKDFWKLKFNNSDLCYIKRVMPKFYCEQ